MSNRDQLLQAMATPGRCTDRQMEQLIEALEQEEPADLADSRAPLAGVWELRWSSSSLPYLMVAPWLENLQVLRPELGRGMNLLRPAGPLAGLTAIGVEASLEVVGNQRVNVSFQKGGWLGPRLGDQRLQLFRRVQQSTPAWLDMTVLDQELRVCRGNAGTLFALKRRPDLRSEDFLPDL
ncbi:MULTISPECIES: PAP/fibrillin family protein [Synechococcaceae]|uniref:PAP/fibrillin family protein n=1 Tax=Synechococcaceae TaxID=1890426 RepID=UPI0008FF5479|nr:MULTISPECIES: PAP/fibrillin family protein [Synechococcaceae]APD48485.1 PAP fibrillin [Synechococcus sp. SynAce01]MCT4363433.1 PAP/fibrillin family protein [Candidatus Regnicoccus frigidus MAG-AL1]MCT4367928.1 PAP/fibrillin family protein [Candidatus Regnicoccus frigidus MAG-AL2]TWB95013.1 PAP fibrillin [Synechococcus sp. Ace-Pa]